MSRGGQVSASLVPGVPQTRVCRCDKPAAFDDSDGRCVKCGHRAEPEPEPTDPAREVAWAFSEILNRDQ